MGQLGAACRHATQGRLAAPHLRALLPLPLARSRAKRPPLLPLLGGAAAAPACGTLRTAVPPLKQLLHLHLELRCR